MTRDISMDMSDAVEMTGSVPYGFALLALFEFDSGDIGMWNGRGQINVDGVDYFGGGNLVAVSPYQETQDLQAKGMVFTLTGVPLNLVEIAENENWQGRKVILRLALMEEDGTVNSTYRLFSGIMDEMDIQEGADTATIQVKAESVLIKLKRAKERRYTDQDQKSRYPNDRGLENMTQLQDKELIW